MIHFQTKHSDHAPFFCKKQQHCNTTSCCNSQGGWATAATRIPFAHSSSNMFHPNSDKNAASHNCHITHQIHQLPISVPVLQQLASIWQQHSS